MVVSTVMSSTLSLRADKKQWWFTNGKIVNKHISEARVLIETQQPLEISAAISHLDAALVISPSHETSLELKVWSLLFLRRFKDVADMLQDYIPSFKSVSDEEDGSSISLSVNSRERVQLLPSEEVGNDHPFLCFSVTELKKKVRSGICKRNNREGHWRYIVLGQACYHLGMLEDAVVLLHTGRRLAAAAFRRESYDLREDNFSDRYHLQHPLAIQSSEPESVANLMNHIKLLVRRRAAAVTALDANLPSESIRHFSKILYSRRGVPSPFAALCFFGRAMAHKSAGRIADAIADCNRALALDPTSIPALRTRSELFESMRSFRDCLRDLDHLKLLYDAILRDRKLPGPPWRPHQGIWYREIAGELQNLTGRTHSIRQRVSKGEGDVSLDCYRVVGVNRGCSRSELERAHLLLSLKHRPDRAAGFVDKIEFIDEHRDVDMVRDEARMSAVILHRLLQKGYSSIMSDVNEQEVTEKRQRVKDNATATVPPVKRSVEKKVVATAPPAAVFQGVFCRDLSAVGSLLSQVVFNHQHIPVKLEGLSC